MYSSAELTLERLKSGAEEVIPLTGWTPLLRRTWDATTSQTSWVSTEAAGDNPGVLAAARVHEWLERNLMIRERTGKKRPFLLNGAQRLLAEHTAWRWGKGLPIKAWVPKARHMGVSSYFQGLTFSLCILPPGGFRCALIAHDEASAEGIFGKSRTFESNLRGDVALNLTNRQAGRLSWENLSETCMGTAKSGDALFRGPSFNAIHFSEVANFSDRGLKAEEPVFAALGGLHDDARAVVVYESTAKGRDAFFFPGCEEARDPESETDSSLVFLPWHLEPAYSMSWDNYRERLIAAGKKDPGEAFELTSEEAVLREKLAATVVGEGEWWWKHRVLLSDEQLIWRRWALVNKCHGKLSLFQRHYPNTYTEAFAATASCMFEADTIDYYRRASRDPAFVGQITRLEGRPKLVEHPRGKIRVWELPQAGRSYVIGADIGGERKGSDPCAAYVVDKHSLEVVAAFHGHVNWEVYAETLAGLGEYYNWALLVPETTGNPAVAAKLHRENYPELYYYTDEGRIRDRPNAPGFSTNRKTRPQILAELDMVCRERLLVCRDWFFPIEMEDFVWQDGKGHYSAGGRGRDDRVMALALAVFCCEYRDSEAQGQEITRGEGNWAYKKFLDIQRRMAEQEEKKVRSEAPGLLL